MGHSLTRDCSAGLGSSSGAAESKMTENSNIEAAGMFASTQPSSPPSGVRKDRSVAWDHFDVENATEKKAKCKYCGSLIQYWNGTSSMGGHLRRCKQNPNNDSNKRKTTTTPTIDERGALNSPSASKFDQEEAQRALVEMFIGEELPFRFVESPKFRRFVHALQATFKVPSQTTLARDIGALNAEEKMKLQDFSRQIVVENKSHPVKMYTGLLLKVMHLQKVRPHHRHHHHRQKLGLPLQLLDL